MRARSKNQAERGSALIGSPDDVAKSIETIIERSGGIGGILGLAHEWASTEATNRSFELFARHVAPRFQGQLEPVYQSRDWVEEHMREVFGGTLPAVAKAFTDAGKELPAAIVQQQKEREERRKARAAAKQGVCGLGAPAFRTTGQRAHRVAVPSGQRVDRRIEFARPIQTT